MDIFDVDDLVGMTIENTTNHYFTITNKLIPPTGDNDPKTLDELYIDFCEFKEQYESDTVLQGYFDDGFMVSDPITDPGNGTVCAYETAAALGNKEEWVTITGTQNDSNKVFTLGKAISYASSFIFNNGTYYKKADYSIAGTTLTFAVGTTAPAPTDILEARGVEV